jgi:hypothetical protein
VTFLMPHRTEFIDRNIVRIKHEYEADRKYMGRTMQCPYLRGIAFVKEEHVGNPEYPTLSR